MKKPKKSDYQTPFILDGSLVKTDYKGYIKALELYISYLENKATKSK